MFNDIQTKEVKFVDDPKTKSALDKVKELSNKAKTQRRRKSPSFINRIKVKDDDDDDTILNKFNQGVDPSKWARRSSHFATTTMQSPLFNLFKHQEETSKGNANSKKFIRLAEKTVPIKEELEEGGEKIAKKENKEKNDLKFDDDDDDDEDKK